MKNQTEALCHALDHLEEHIHFICKTAFLEIRRISTIRHHLTDDASKILVVSLVLFRNDYCNSFLAGLPQSLVGKLLRVQNSAARLVVRALPYVHITPIIRYLHWFPVRARISYETACLCFNAITSSISAYLSDLLHLYSPSRSLHSNADTHLLKIPFYECKTKVIVLSLSLVILSGTRCHCTLEMLQLSTPSGLL